MSPVGSIVRLRPDYQPTDPRRPYTHQKEAWASLDAHLGEAKGEKGFRGLLVSPTGSGKAYMASHWLMRNVVNEGGRVVWLTLGDELLDQAASEFYRLAGLACKKPMVRVRIVSGRHCSVTQLDPADDIVVGSVASLAPRLDVVAPILRDPRTFVVVDECHHAPAATYRRLVEMLPAEGGRILGLTATPTRTKKSERPVLGELFGNRIIHEVGFTELVERGVLARPIPVRVRTHAAVGRGVSRGDEEYLAESGELSKSWYSRIARLEARNHVVVDQYLKHRALYGKTIVFAINIPHAALLTGRLRAAGVRAEYVASNRDDGGDNRAVIESFRHATEVLVNVQMLAEGVDLPSVRTVMLARPTTSEVLLRQMIGRALRGPAVGGTEVAYIVAFEDIWERNRDWQSPLDLVPDLASGPSRGSGSLSTRGRITTPPSGVIEGVAERVRQAVPRPRIDSFAAEPDRWYVLGHEIEGRTVRRIIAAFAHQVPCWEELFVRLELLSAERIAVAQAGSFDEVFTGCRAPVPSTHDVGVVLDHMRHRRERPVSFGIEERMACEPKALARQILDADMGERARNALLERSYGPLAEAIYTSKREFRSAVEDALFELQLSGAVVTTPHAPVFAPVTYRPLAPGPHHELDRLVAEMLEAGRSLLGNHSPLPHPGSVTWTPRPLRGWCGPNLWAPGQSPSQGVMRVNRKLDSPDVPADVLRFVLWHAYLHLYLRQGHTRAFREVERKWPGTVEAERFLGSLDERFGEAA